MSDAQIAILLVIGVILWLGALRVYGVTRKDREKGTNAVADAYYRSGKWKEERMKREIFQCFALLDIDIPFMAQRSSDDVNEWLRALGYATRARPGGLIDATGRALHREIHEKLNGAPCSVCVTHPLKEDV